MCRAFNTLGKHNGTYAKALLHGQGEVPENGDRGSEIQHVGTYGALQVEIQGWNSRLRAESYSSSTLRHRLVHRLCSPAPQACSVFSE